MGTEIERKFLLKEDEKKFYTSAAQELFELDCIDLEQRVYREGTPILQGYMSLGDGRSFAESLHLDYSFVPVEARLRKKGNLYLFSLKGPEDIERDETFISQGTFWRTWGRTQGRCVEKRRLTLHIDGVGKSELDMYTDRDLFVAKIEVTSQEAYDALPILGKDVTCDKNYKNKELAV